MARVLRIGKVAALIVLRGGWLSTLVILPLFGMWLASSLAAYGNATQWLSLLIGLLLFPIVPVGWDLLFVWRMRRRADHKPILTRLDRLVLRTLIVNLIFAGGLLWQQPVTVYKALSVRGDWMLDGRDGPIASWLRARLFTIADGLRRGWTPGGDAHYGDSDDAPSQPPPPPPEPEPPVVEPEAPEVPDAPDAPDAPPPPEPAPDPGGWPMPETIDPVVAAMPADVQTSIASIGAYLAANIADERQRVKAVHDVVVQRLTYDDDALRLIRSRRFDDVPSMEAEPVFARRSGVCAGYARLMAALGAAAGLEIKYVTGFARGTRAGVGSEEQDDDVLGLGGNEHAWNVARIGRYWYPIDATWDDGEDEYTTTYLLTPPAVFLLDHFPSKEVWQLVARKKSVADFLRQPAINADFTALGLTLRSPERSQVSVSGSIDLVVDNPRRRDVMATVSPAGAGIGDKATTRDCGYTDHAKVVKLRCGRLADGEWRVDLWASQRGKTSLAYVGSIWANSR